MANAQDYKPTQDVLEGFGKYVMTEIAKQAGGLDKIGEIHPRDLIPANSITVDLVKELQQYGKLCIVGININD